MMKAMVCHELGAPSVLRLEERPNRVADRGEIRIGVRAAGINFPDLLMIAGLYQHKPPLPFIPGFEIAGEVIETGPGTDGRKGHLKPGARVMASVRTGGYASEVVAPAAAVRPLPDRFDFVQGAAFQVAYNTAYVALVSRGRLVPGESLLVHGAGGGVGLAAVELGKALGASVIAAVGSRDKRHAVIDAGADHVIFPKPGFREQVKALTDGRGADVVYDPVGGAVFEESLRCTAWGGRLLVIGFAAGQIPSAPANLPLIKGFSIVGVRAGEFGRRHPRRAARNHRALLKLARDGTLTPRIHAALPLEEAADAMELLSQRKVIGKVVLTP